ncbi:Hpt domain-containing protein [Desulfogranum mediterraneum]|uniref:Hpt domain-containing protein n=1 Tax=Desulfogranum mediterraneum TaxID=160661 RepID=UPI00040D509F|nr:Hpt domain-containing protein [Desulfogranum mediterraneum]
MTSVSLQWNRDFALEQTAGDEELLAELITLFQDSAQSDFQQLQEAVTAGDSDQVIAAAHSLKGASASLGIEGIRALAMEIEEGVRGGQSEVDQAKLAAMGTLIKELQGL